MARERRSGREDVVGTGTTAISRLSAAYTRIRRTTIVNMVTMMTIGTTWRRRKGRTRTTM